MPSGAVYTVEHFNKSARVYSEMVCAVAYESAALAV
jgi:hypothetical protein